MSDLDIDALEVDLLRQDPSLSSVAEQLRLRMIGRVLVSAVRERDKRIAELTNKNLILSEQVAGLSLPPSAFRRSTPLEDATAKKVDSKREAQQFLRDAE